MEKKTTQRIIGISVIIALIIILLPLLFTKNNVTTQTITVKAPPLPEELHEVTPPTIANARQPIASESIPTPDSHPLDSSMMTSAAEPLQQTPPIHPNESKTNVITNVKTSERTLKNNSLEKNTIGKDKISTPLSNEDEMILKKDKPLKRIQPKNTAAFQLKKRGWAVQLGCFKNKNNAIRLTERLRHLGYKAYMHETHGTEKKTLVFVGPEYRHTSAIKLSNKLDQEMKLQTFIVKYRPLA